MDENVRRVSDIERRLGKIETAEAWPAGEFVRIASVGTTYTVAQDIRVVITDSSGGPFTVTLPSASGAGFDSGIGAGQMVTVKRVAGASTVTVGRSGSDLIDGAASYALDMAYDAVTVVSDGAAWYIVAKVEM